MDSQTDNTNDLDFQDLVSNYYRPLYRFAYSLARNAEEASDLAPTDISDLGKERFFFKG